MQRRTLLQWLAGLCGTLPFSTLQAWSQTAGFPGTHTDVLSSLASIVLPSALGPAGTDRVVKGFERYVREYRPGADTDHGYGFTYVRVKPASPARLYTSQLAALPSPLTRAAVEQALDAAHIIELPHLPEGTDVIVDLMSFYFRSSDANDLCYRAAIKRDVCRGLAGLEHAPTPLKELS